MTEERLFAIRDKRAIVTGAASGLGFAYAEVLAENGAQVTLVDKEAAALDDAVARLAAKGLSVEGVVLDVTDTPRLAATIEAITRKHGGLDIAFANAGMSAGPGFASEEGRMGAVATARWNAVLALNLTAVFETVRAAALPMRQQKSGRIIVTASIAGMKAERQVGYAYVATKAAVINLVRQAALELAPDNVLINAIAPGPFLTNIAGGRMHRDPAAIRDWENVVPLGRVANPDEIKGLALLLASPASSYITGTVIPIDGGITAG